LVQCRCFLPASVHREGASLIFSYGYDVGEPLGGLPPWEVARWRRFTTVTCYDAQGNVLRTATEPKR
jgi:hypothetical protein